MGEWQTTTLGELCEAIVDCEHKTAPIDERGSYFAVGTPAMQGNTIDYGQARRISRVTFEAWTNRLRPRFGDLLLAREAPVGPIVRIPQQEDVAPGQRTVLLRPDPRRADSGFLHHLLTSRTVQDRMASLAEGSTVAHLNVADVRVLDLRVPPSLAEQRAIAEVLGALDDKIAANTRLATAADELAKALFRVAVRGVEPGAKTFADVAEIGGGGTPSSKVPKYWDGELGWASPTDITRLSGQPYLFETARSITPSGLANCASRMYPKGSLLMTSRATIGAFALAMTPTAVNQGFIVVVPPDNTLRYWLFHEMRDRVDEFLTHANGATFLELSRGNFRRLPVRLAEPSVMEEFGDRAGTLHTSAAATVRENRSLVATRDALLPALMSGALRVRDAERLVEDLT